MGPADTDLSSFFTSLPSLNATLRSACKLPGYVILYQKVELVCLLHGKELLTSYSFLVLLSVTSQNHCPSKLPEFRHGIRKAHHALVSCSTQPLGSTFLRRLPHRVSLNFRQCTHLYVKACTELLSMSNAGFQDGFQNGRIHSHISIKRRRRKRHEE